MKNPFSRRQNSLEPESLELKAAERAAAPLEAEIQSELGQKPARRDPYAILRLPDFRRYWLGGIFAAAGAQMLMVAAGWEVYERTGQPFSLGLLGLMAAMPVIFLALPAGGLADRFERKKIVLIGEIAAVVCSLGLFIASAFEVSLVWFYGLILLLGICGAFIGPASQALVVGLVPDDKIADATKWSSIRWQIAATMGPVLGGFLIAHWFTASPIYFLDAVARLVFCAFLWPIRPRIQQKSKEAMSWKSLMAGVQFVRSKPLILSTISLDMIAVLFGGATALLPIYAKDILQTGPAGLGPLRAAPALGAMTMGFFLTQMPPMQRAGKSLLWAVAGFGFATIIFGISKIFWVSLVALFALGALDNISVVVRHTLLQVLTPDEMRGRVSAVNSVFIGTSNEIGELESGLAAQWLGPIWAVAGGGLATILLVGAVARGWPQIAKLKSLENAGRE